MDRTPRINKDGYRVVWQPADDPLFLGSAAKRKIGGTWVGEHRVVMANLLGRVLTKTESVHHRNGVKHDNSPSNLELWIGGIRFGQRRDEALIEYLVALGREEFERIVTAASLLRGEN